MMLFALSMLEIFSNNYTDIIAERTSKRIESRLEILKKHVAHTHESPINQTIPPHTLPKDMVIYRYVNDSLKSWNNHFSVVNDDISVKLEIPKLASRRSRLVSPLNDANGSFSFVNLGPKWYLIKTFDYGHGEEIIAGLEIQNKLIVDHFKSGNGVNPYLKLSDRFTILPLQHCEGSPVTIEETPLFTIVYSPTSATGDFNNSLLRWLALLFLVASAVLFLALHRTFKTYIAVNIVLLGIFCVAFIWGYHMGEGSTLFSPSIYADRTFFSLGALLLANVYVILFNVCAYIIRRRIVALIRQSDSHAKLKKGIYGLIILSLATGTVLYVHNSLTSLTNNSSITLELYRWNTQTFYTVLIYLSYAGIFISILLLLQMLRPVAWKLAGIRYNIFSRRSLSIMAFIWALYMTVSTAVLGFKKEEDRVEVWANRLAVDRNISLEIQLISLEESIATDQLLWTLTAHQNTRDIILKRVSEYHLGHLHLSYKPTITLVKEGDNAALSYLEEVISNGTPISGGSRFLVVKNGGRNSYAGIFLFYSPEVGTTHMILEIESDNVTEDKGYFTFLKRQSNPGAVTIPPIYSYAKYDNKHLASYKGNYPYPTLIPKVENYEQKSKNKNVYREGGYVHFHHYFSDEEVIVISRPKRSAMVFIVVFSI